MRVCGDIGLRSIVRKPLLLGRVALEGRTIERTPATAAPAVRIARCCCAPPRCARAALCNQPLKLLTALERGTLNAALAQPQRSVNNPSL